MRHLRLKIGGSTLIGFLLLLIPVAANAATANVSYPYQSTSVISPGSIVSAASNKTGYIDLANTNNSSKLLGVAVNRTDSLIAVGQSQATIQVAVNGIAEVLVSNLNGNISYGTEVSASPLNGIGMKALPGARTIGIAESALSGSEKTVTTEEVKNKNGQTTTVKVGYIDINIAIGTSSVPTGGQKLNSLQKVIRSLTGKSIPTIRIIISLAIAFFAGVALITIIYSSISKTVVSVGRNPLAKHAIFVTLGFIMLMALSIGGVAVIVIYFLLT
jgi:hypothetical protein